MIEREENEQALIRWWPLFGLSVTTSRLELRPVSDADLPELADLLRLGVHAPDEMPFDTPWTDASEPELQRQALQWSWRMRAAWSIESWSLPFAVREAGRIVGMQDLKGVEFPTLRRVETGSWVSRPSHGQGIGKEMRAAVLHFAFAGLRAQRAETRAFENNPASLAVTRSLGYLPNGEELKLQRGQIGRQLRFQMPCEAWEERRRDDIEIHGLDDALPMFGITNGPGSAH